MSNLSTDQQAAFDDAVSGKNILITGPGGTGKSHLLRHITDWFDGKRAKLGITGATGAAAVNVGGTTLHSWCGIGLGEGSKHRVTANVMRNVPAVLRIRNTDALAIDEVSMVPAELFDKLDHVFQEVRENSLPFGGMQLILFGDFLQLPPVDGKFTFEAENWGKSDIGIHVLQHVFRQEDRAFAEVLGKIRMGLIDEQVRGMILPRSKAVDGSPEVKPVVLSPKNELARRINQREIDALEGDGVTIEAQDTGGESGIRVLEKGTIPKVLVLKPGCRVICCVNWAPELGIMNGSAGVVLKVWPSPAMVTVQFDNGEVVDMPRFRKEIRQDGKVVASRFQVPLKHGFAISIHGSQGMTLDKVEAHLADCFEHGQAYVALSRVRTLEGLFLKSLRKESIRVHPKALEFYSGSGHECSHA